MFDFKTHRRTLEVSVKNSQLYGQSPTHVHSATSVLFEASSKDSELSEVTLSICCDFDPISLHILAFELKV